MHGAEDDEEGFETVSEEDISDDEEMKEWYKTKWEIYLLNFN